MKRGLFSKMVAAYTVIIAVSFVMTSAILSFWFERYSFDQRTDELTRAAITIAQQYMQPGGLSQESLSEKLKDADYYFNAEIILIDNKGYVFGASDMSSALINKQIINQELEELRKGNTIVKEGTFKNIFKYPVRTCIRPVMSENNTFQYAIMMSTSLSEVGKPLIKVYEIIWILAAFAIIIPCFILYFFSQRIIVKPLAAINSVAGKLAKGEVDKRVVMESEDEIGELAKTFNYMADSLAKVEKNRREFISNVSHEIRSPITSIKGFIGGILDGVIPKEKQEYYLTLAYDETQRLTRLVNDLLDLSTIDSGQLTLHKSKFNINELIRRTIIKFEEKIREKNIKVDVCFSKDELYVIGDLDRIIQVFTNLIDNAIKYVKDDGKIKVLVKAKGDKAYISIYNDSEPLSQEDLTHMWDRFYKVDKSRTMKVSTGLGLPIVRSILTEHGEDIWVENSSEGGVEFVFTLRKARE